MLAPGADFLQEEGSPGMVKVGTVGDEKVGIVKRGWETNPDVI